MITLLDYGAGNVRSVRNAIMKLGYEWDDEKAKVNLKKCRVIFNLGTDSSLLAQNDIRSRG